MDPAEWAFYLLRLSMDGPRGPQTADVVRRFVAGEIDERCELDGWDEESPAP